MRKLPRQFLKVRGHKFIVFTPSSENVKQAFERSQKLGITPNSFTRGLGRMTGFLGEIAFGLLYPDATYVGGRCFTHDYTLKGKKIDIKSKSCSGEPLPHYMASVNCPASKAPEAGYYYFSRVRKDLSAVWMLGWLPTPRILKVGDYKKRGEKGDDGFIYRVSGYHIPIESLRAPASF
tara:strand:- start:563 stop:1096 length:534 start_codon:yes stop_codon:yes gene_type:complete